MNRTAWEFCYSPGRAAAGRIPWFDSRVKNYVHPKKCMDQVCCSRNSPAVLQARHGQEMGWLAMSSDKRREGHSTGDGDDVSCGYSLPLHICTCTVAFDSIQ